MYSGKGIGQAAADPCRSFSMLTRAVSILATSIITPSLYPGKEAWKIDSLTFPIF